jgi:spore maturation protein CgeB
MKILLIGPYYANAGHGAECGIYDALVELGHEVEVLDLRAMKFKRLHLPEPKNFTKTHPFRETYDLILCPGPGLPPEYYHSSFWNLLEGVKVLWNSEPLRLGQYENRMVKNLGKFHAYLTFDESEIPIYRELGIENVHFLPQGYNPKWYKPLHNQPAKDICFIASMGPKWKHRTVLLDRLRKSFKISAGTVFDANRVNMTYNAHKFSLNLGLYCPESGPMSDLRGFGLQQRIFEAIGAGRPTITNEIPGDTNQLFVDRENIVFYNRDNMEEQIEWALENWGVLYDGVMAIREQHSYRARMERMIQIVCDFNYL